MSGSATLTTDMSSDTRNCTVSATTSCHRAGRSPVSGALAAPPPGSPAVSLLPAPPMTSPSPSRPRSENYHTRIEIKRAGTEKGP